MSKLLVKGKGELLSRRRRAKEWFGVGEILVTVRNTSAGRCVSSPLSLFTQHHPLHYAPMSGSSYPSARPTLMHASEARDAANARRLENDKAALLAKQIAIKDQWLCIVERVQNTIKDGKTVAKVCEILYVENHDDLINLGYKITLSQHVTTIYFGK